MAGGEELEVLRDFDGAGRLAGESGCVGARGVRGPAWRRPSDPSTRRPVAPCLITQREDDGLNTRPSSQRPVAEPVLVEAARPVLRTHPHALFTQNARLRLLLAVLGLQSALLPSFGGSGDLCCLPVEVSPRARILDTLRVANCSDKGLGFRF